MATHTSSPSVDIGGGRSIGGTGASYSGTGVLFIDGETITTGSTDTLVTGTIDVSAVKSCIIFSDRAITLETNATDATGGNTLALAAGIPYVWNTSSYDTFKLTLDVTKFYITNASGATATLYIHVISDATP
mgnify:CR=1 FL=1